MIGITGKKGAGKTVVANYLVSKGMKSLPFKMALKGEMIANLYSTLKEIGKIYGVGTNELFEKKPPVMRALMQNYGTEVRRGDDPDYWVKKWKSLATTQTVVDDVRFLNEARAVRDMGGKIIRIVREGQQHNDSHQSETEMDSIDVDETITVKTGDFESLYKELDRIYEATSKN